MHISYLVQPDAYANVILSTFDEQGLLIRLIWWAVLRYLG